jgi:hypothetical protein
VVGSSAAFFLGVGGATEARDLGFEAVRGWGTRLGAGLFVRADRLAAGVLGGAGDAGLGIEDGATIGDASRRRLDAGGFASPAVGEGVGNVLDGGLGVDGFRGVPLARGEFTGGWEGTGVVPAACADLLERLY